VTHNSAPLDGTMARLPAPRPISPREVAVLARMLERCAVQGSVTIDLASLQRLNVVARCDCGCDTVDFQSVDWSTRPAVIADGQGKTETGDEVGVIVFGNGSVIACLEVYNYGDEPARLPAVETIQPYGARAHDTV
jgi:hypothetical protein